MTSRWSIRRELPTLMRTASAADAPLLEWEKGEVMAPDTFLAFMVGTTTPTEPVMEERDIWSDVEVLRFI